VRRNRKTGKKGNPGAKGIVKTEREEDYAKRKLGYGGKFTMRRPIRPSPEERINPTEGRPGITGGGEGGLEGTRGSRDQRRHFLA